MASHSVNESPTFRPEIADSHDRCRQFGIDPSATRNLSQVHLTQEELTARREANRDLLDVACVQIQELYRFVAGAGFAVGVVDREGFLLDIIGDSPLLEILRNGNFIPGYRWTEADVGTGAISLGLARRTPVQVTDDEHYCKRGYGHTCSASPIFGEAKELIGLIAMTGEASKVHPHSLGMVITAAKAIENQMRITKTSQELLLRNNYMTAIIESIDGGVMAVDKNGIITQVNNQARKILQWEDQIEGRPLSTLLGSKEDLQTLLHTKSGFTDREIFVKGPRGVLQLIANAKPIPDSQGEVQGIIFIFQEIDRIRRLVNKMAGSQARFTFEDILGISNAIQEAKKLGMLAAAGKSNVLLLGETGTGKELFAQSIHNHSKRRQHPFVTINCGAIPRELLESELFGYVEGSFTGARRGGRPGKLELADGGTVFLDEIGDMSVDMQVKLLRVLQSGEVYRIGQHKSISVDLRIIAASHFDLKQEVGKGNFREDLFYRLNVLPIRIPPLRERPEDILLLAKHALKRCGQVLNKPSVKFSPNSEQVLLNHLWPGNVRELENVIERAVNLVEGQIIEPRHFGPLTSKKEKSTSKETQGISLKDMEKEIIAQAIRDTGSNLARTAKTLGISRATLYKKIKKFNLSIDRISA